MKQLFWKEWHELRLLPLAAAFSMGLLIFGARIYLKDAYRGFQFSDTLPALYICWVFFALLSAAPLFSQEIGDGSLILLSALPLNRRRIWGVKAALGFGILVQCLLASALVWIAVCVVLFHERAGDFAVTVGFPLLWAILAFAVALAVSPFLDRPLSVFFAALLLFSGVFYGIGVASGLYSNYYSTLFYRDNPSATHYFGPHLLYHGVLCLLMALMIPVFAAVSYGVFTRGEQLRSAKRFRVGALVGSASLTVAALTFCFGSCLQWW